MYKQEYLSKIKEMLNDDQTYKVIKNDPTVKYMNMANSLVNSSLSKNVINKDTKKHLVTRQALPPKLYVLKKIYKPVLSLGPVVSCIDSPSYKITRFLHDLFTPTLSTVNYNLKILEKLVEYLQTIKLRKTTG